MVVETRVVGNCVGDDDDSELDLFYDDERWVFVMQLMIYELWFMIYNFMMMKWLIFVIQLAITGGRRRCVPATRG